MILTPKILKKINFTFVLGNPTTMETWPIFKNRQDAGLQLAQKLSSFKSENPLIIGIPRGGVEVAYYTAKILTADFSIIISKKIAHPLHPEYGIGAITEKEIVYVPTNTNIDTKTINYILQNVKQELSRRILTYRKIIPFPEVKNRVTILIDDGIATGVTIVPVIRLCRKLNAKKIIVAVPVCGRHTNPDLNEADEFISLYQPLFFSNVGQYYGNFNQLQDSDVTFFLEKIDWH